jgi:hypothetical protein
VKVLTWLFWPVTCVAHGRRVWDRSRCYHPGLERFVSEDPLECERGRRRNLYVGARSRLQVFGYANDYLSALGRSGPRRRRPAGGGVLPDGYRWAYGITNSHLDRVLDALSRGPTEDGPIDRTKVQ